MAGVAFEVFGQLAFKRGAAHVVAASGARPAIGYWRDLALEPQIHVGIVLQVVALLFWIAALNIVPLSVAFPFASLSYCGVAIAGHYLLGEKLGRRSIAAIGMITIGAALVCWPH